MHLFERNELESSRNLWVWVNCVQECIILHFWTWFSTNSYMHGTYMSYFLRSFMVLHSTSHIIMFCKEKSWVCYMHGKNMVYWTLFWRIEGNLGSWLHNFHVFMLYKVFISFWNQPCKLWTRKRCFWTSNSKLENPKFA